ncbi:excisionase [Paraburkholderia sp. USG1]|uniref:excisionase n=1 Tax=Paraburkholderia sp. USG1 TaxID=2952268 RepID=UPI00285B2A0B|nr:excisionase [Paraburkholderia sp. USG1]MDR8395531.1 excisionase [Paraburkholderia sp. USG1]
MKVVELPKLMTLEAWAERLFGEAKPHRNTLLNWRRNGRIVPQPIKCGGRYFVEPDAVYCDDAGEMSRRLGNGR